MKTVTLDDAAYALLRGAKQAPQESFSTVVKRLLGATPRLEDAFGGWADMTDEEVKRLRDETVAMFGTTGDE